jgi:hypothetical protein
MQLSHLSIWLSDYQGLSENDTGLLMAWQSFRLAILLVPIENRPTWKEPSFAWPTNTDLP